MSLLVWVAAVLPVLLVGGIVAWWVYHERGAGVGGVGGGAGEVPREAAEPATLAVGRDYYVFAKTIELYPRQPGDRTWDRIGDSAPDVQYAVTWQGHTVFTSSVRDDTLLATWDGISLDVRKAVFEGEVEPGQTLNHAAPVNVTDDNEITVKVWDKDPIGLGEDDAGEVTLRLASLHEGDNVIELKASDANGIKRIVLRATGTDQPMDNLMEAITAP